MVLQPCTTVGACGFVSRGSSPKGDAKRSHVFAQVALAALDCWKLHYWCTEKPDAEPSLHLRLGQTFVIGRDWLHYNLCSTVIGGRLRGKWKLIPPLYFSRANAGEQATSSSTFFLPKGREVGRASTLLLDPSLSPCRHTWLRSISRPIFCRTDTTVEPKKKLNHFWSTC